MHGESESYRSVQSVSSRCGLRMYITPCEWIYCSYGLSVCYIILVSIHLIILY